MGTNNIENLRTWFLNCVSLKSGTRFGVDYMGDDPIEYALYSVPSQLAYHENILGERVPNDIQTVNFIFASQEYYGNDVDATMANIRFYDEVIEWILEQNQLGTFPEWEGGIVTSITPSLTAFPANVGGSTARYQLQLTVVYRRI